MRLRRTAARLFQSFNTTQPATDLAMNASARGIPLRPDAAALVAEQRRSLHRAFAAIELKASPSSRVSREEFCASALAERRPGRRRRKGRDLAGFDHDRGLGILRSRRIAT